MASAASGHVIATSPRIDLALIKVEAKQPLPTVHWGNSDDVRIGEPVFAVGNPLGIGVSVTSGIISGLNRNLLDTPFDDFSKPTRRSITATPAARCSTWRRGHRHDRDLLAHRVRRDRFRHPVE